MVHVYARHTVEDYETWKETFDRDRASRKQLGARDIETFQVYGRTDTVVVLMELDDSAVANTVGEDIATAYADVMTDTDEDSLEILILEKTDELPE